MNQPLLSTTIKKGIPLREVYKNSGSYGETDKKAYINFMKSFWKDGFPVGYYVVDGYADFYILSNIDGEEKCTTCNRNKGFHVSQLEDELTKLPDYGKTLHYEVKGEGILPLIS